MRANALVREPEIQKLWDDNQVFKRVVNKNDGVGFVAILLWALYISDMNLLADLEVILSGKFYSS